MPQCSLCHASVSWSVLGAVLVLKARPSWVKLKSWLIPSSTTPRGYYFHPFPDDQVEGAKYRFSGFTPNKQTNKHTHTHVRDVRVGARRNKSAFGRTRELNCDQDTSIEAYLPTVCDTADTARVGLSSSLWGWDNSRFGDLLGLTMVRRRVRGDGRGATRASMHGQALCTADGCVRRPPACRWSPTSSDAHMG